MPGTLSSYALVALGGAFGAMARFAVASAVARRFPAAQFPAATLAINLTGCFAIALFLSAASSRTPWSEAARLLFPVGFVGAYTTFSTYEWELLTLAGQRAWGALFAYFISSNAIGFAAVALGAWIGRRM